MSQPSDQPSFRYSAAFANEIEQRWQSLWESNRVYSAPNPGEPGFDGAKPKKFVLDMFPYPSGVGLHVGHPLGYIATDIFARYLRMTGHNVLHAMGFDAFGLPAEQYAVQTNQHPRKTTYDNIANMKVQLRRLGLGHDPRRGVATTDPGFYKWTQWIFLQIYNSWYDAPAARARPIKELFAAFESGKVATKSGRPWSALSEADKRDEIDSRRLAFLAEVPVNWCPMLGTVLANEEVTADGRSERGNYPVYKRPLKQWMMRITAYADRLIEDLAELDWPEPIKHLQRNWIGRSEGAIAKFALPSGADISVFTTRPDTLFGATYMVLSPEHPLVEAGLTPTPNAPAPTFRPALFPGYTPAMSTRDAVAAYRAYAKSKSDDDRQNAKDKTGCFTGAYATNPVTGQNIPIFIADYVLMGYGTGAIMAVPAHDERDFEFAQAMNLPIVDVVYPRPVLAMSYFAQHAYAGEPAANWREELSDFLGVCVSEPGVEPDEAMRIIRERRQRPVSANSPSPTPIDAPGEVCDVPGAIGQRRGPTRSVWLETIESLRFSDFPSFARCFADRAYFKHIGQAGVEQGVAVNSQGPQCSINGLPTADAKRTVGEWLRANGRGEPTVNYKLRDWLFSRQRYWGEPFPIVFDDQGVAHDLPESMLPVLLPELTNFRPESSEDPNAPVRTPLARATDWTTVELDLGQGRKKYTRETNTMPNWAGSCWYYLRYLDPENSKQFCGQDAERYWMAGLSPQSAGGPAPSRGVDLYVGGVEHAVLHLLYARFWHKVLFDLGHVSTKEPFHKLFNQGYIQAYAFKDARGAYVEASKVTLPDGSLAMENQEHPGPYTYEGQPVKREYGKMGKSLKNAATPDDICAAYGCDTLRVYEMSMGPLEASKPWNTRDIAGAFRFLQRVWRNLVDESTGASRVTDTHADRDTQRILHKTIIGVRKDMDTLGFNTVVSKLIELNNHLSGLASVPMEAAKPLILMLAPLAPHFAEELFHRVVRAGRPPASIAHEPFPVADAALAADDEIEIPISVNGRPKHRIKVAPNLPAAALEAAALADPKVQELAGGKAIKKIIVVPGKMVNLVVG